MKQRYFLASLPFVAACSASLPHAASSPAEARASRAATGGPTPAASAQSPRVIASSSGAEATDSALDSDAASDQAYLDNTRRAVELYQKFVELAGTDPIYAEAVKRSREQIEDLSGAGVFVSQGMKERAGK